MNAEQPIPDRFPSTGSTCVEPQAPTECMRCCAPLRAHSCDAMGMPVVGCRLVLGDDSGRCPRGVSQYQGYEEHSLRLTPVSRWILRGGGIRVATRPGSTCRPRPP